MGSKHIQFLLDKNLLNVQSSPILDDLYSGGKKPFEATSKPSKHIPEPLQDAEETMVLTEAQGKVIATVLEIPELYIELKRAVWQVKKSLETQKEVGKEKAEVAAPNDKSKNI